MRQGRNDIRPASRQLPPETYRRRRLGVAGAVLAVVAVSVWIAAGGGDAGAGGGGEGDSSPAALRGSATPSPDSTPRPAETRTVTATPGVRVTVTATPKPAGISCRKAAPRVAVRRDRDRYRPGQQPTFTARVSAKKSCWMDPDRLEVRVSSGQDVVWSSRHCRGDDRGFVWVSPGHPYQDKVEWARDRSNPAKCGQDTASVGADWYAVAVSFGQHGSGKKSFRLR